MKRSFTAVIERNATHTESFVLEPYECGWASEALWFIKVIEVTGKDTSIKVRGEISPDGLFWCDSGKEALKITKTGLYPLSLRDFGHWLRLTCTLKGKKPKVKLMIYLSLKE